MSPPDPDAIILTEPSFSACLASSDFAALADLRDEAGLAMKSVLCWTRERKRFFFTHSFTYTTSGAYGDFPPRPKRDETRAFAAACTSASRSTNARTGAFEFDTRS